MSLKIRDLILNINYPVVVKNLEIPWKCTGSTLEQWAEEWDRACPEGVHFTESNLKMFDYPQFETLRQKTPKLSMRAFLDHSKEEKPEKWMSYSYKYLKDCPGFCGKDIDFSVFGFPEIKDDIALWLGSKGAHTPCHFDTLGRNVVVQVFGRKRWILFPPDAELNSTRIPFEETSVYCNNNLFSPENISEFLHNEPFVVELGPGDVLILPPKWWHYVEVLETALAFNAWIPIDDFDHQIEECIVKSLVSKLVTNIDDDLKSLLLFPDELNEMAMLANKSIEYFQEICMHICKLKLDHDKRMNDEIEGGGDAKKSRQESPYETNYLSEDQIEAIIADSAASIKPVDQLNTKQFIDLLNANSSRFDPSEIQRFPTFQQNRKRMENIAGFINSVVNDTAIQNMKYQILAKIIEN